MTRYLTRRLLQMIPLLLFMGVGVSLRWQTDKLRRVMKYLVPIMIISLALSSILLKLCLGHIEGYPLSGLTLGLWIISGTMYLAIRRTLTRGVLSLSQAFWGMLLSHSGVAITVIGVSVSTGYGIQEDVKMSPGESFMLAGYKVTFLKELPLKGPNYEGTRASFRVVKGSHSKVIYPEKRFYNVTKMPMTDSAIDVSPFRDVYIALGEPLDDDSWSVRLYLKPLVRWIWAGGFFIFLGGLLGLTDRRYFDSRKRKAT